MNNTNSQEQKELPFEPSQDTDSQDTTSPTTFQNKVDPRNGLNDLTNKEWMITTKSVWRSDFTATYSQDGALNDRLPLLIQQLVDKFGEEVVQDIFGQLLPSVTESRPTARDTLKSKHPATFAESDIEKLILFFTKRGETVLDPFVGSGSTLVAAKSVQRHGIGVELVSQWAESARKRVETQLPLLRRAGVEDEYAQRVIEGDARRELPKLSARTVDFVVTSPPYWSILHKDTDHKVTRERKTKGLETRYSELEDDLGNIGSYEAFLDEVKKVFAECHRVLKQKKYMCVVVSDFRDRGRFIAYHSDVARIVEECGFALQGITILVQDSKNLYPYGIPYAFVSNIHHQYILIFRKKEASTQE